ncbi:MAG: FMN-binding negative transcriptional regulator [Phenylobacterium sp.]|uniref:FMN-binding negative transcriptional regulator n=1 Tax=Phenylobacterium sp. TaxID=1871053 RepID=UPI00273778E1|nr:FMN-binding negative transcriptional regulator [Phenylobacterium sp.]MDP1643712.1 FMN-binding negative transcriptional regulator [Phenylobacterium sp.]MDP3116859.1 FMN-binding negative transcriptional regulator [Phenylobacterium sp.]MDP3382739.1 FMN-binding negative transcriptional regulator [Phenylobacterium sp.]
MHPAPPFRVSEMEALIAHLTAYPFMGLFAAGEAGLRVAHAPVVVRRTGEGVALDFHLSRNNILTPLFAEGAVALAVSQGPEAYVSPDWYERPDQVPTWNYLSVEAEGEVRPLGEADLVQILDDLSAQAEAGLAPKPAWTRHKMSPGRFEAMLAGIQGFRLRPHRLEGTFKLSQNKPPEVRQRIAVALGDHPIADAMGQDASN